MTSLSTVLEQDFTVEGKKGNLGCPFSQPKGDDTQNDSREGAEDPMLHHHSADPMCAAMNDETNSQQAAVKCPIRYMDQHSPEEIADYLEKHKHELPRSHEVCVRRYQKNEEHIRKLDAKYGNLANMVEGLSRIHQPMLPEQDTRPQSDVERGSNERVENWAQTVSAADDQDHIASAKDDASQDRQSHFDRPLKEVRLGESPSRPWGISVPIFTDGRSSRNDHQNQPESPPPAPVQMPASLRGVDTPLKKTGKCPFDHTKMPQMLHGSIPAKLENSDAGPHGVTGGGQSSNPAQHHPQTSHLSGQPAFVNTAGLNQTRPTNNTPQMVFTGPVFIGYPVEQAMQLIQQFQAHQR